MHALKLIRLFARVSFQEEAAYRANFFLSLMVSALNLITGVIGIAVLFGQVETVNGWSFGATLALLSVYLMTGALRNLVFGPSLESLSGMDGEVWSGRLDFTLLRPVNTQLLASFRKWRLFSLADLAFGAGVLIYALAELHQSLTWERIVMFVLALVAGVAILYAILLASSALVFWSPGVLFTWVFDGIFQLARYPLGMYPGWLQLVLTWVIPVGMITTIPAGVLSGNISAWMLVGILGMAVLLTLAASWIFRIGLARYKSASS